MLSKNARAENNDIVLHQLFGENYLIILEE